MSEFHPNRTKPVRTKPGLTARRIIECWPLLVWVAVAFVAWRIYASGVNFVRMNGAVDVYQENMTPVNEGRLLEIKVKRGAKVPAGAVVAVMDSSKYELDLESLRRGIVADRLKAIRTYDSDLLKLEGDLRDLQTADSEDSAIIKEMEALAEANRKQMAGMDPKLQRMLENDPNLLRSKVELAKSKGRNALNPQQQSAVKENIARIKLIRETFQKEADLIAKIDIHGASIAKSNALRDDELQKYIEITTKIELCQIKTARGGTVDRIGKEVGEYVKPGDGILKIVGDAAQVICFLPQDQAGDLKEDQTVWVVNTSNKAEIYESKVIGVSPRINNLADATSPLPNQRVHGRDILVAYPQEAIKDGKYLLLPGQTVIVHLEKPGEVNILDRILHNDDNGKVH